MGRHHTIGANNPEQGRQSPGDRESTLYKRGQNTLKGPELAPHEEIKPPLERKKRETIPKGNYPIEKFPPHVNCWPKVPKFNGWEKWKERPPLNLNQF